MTTLIDLRMEFVRENGKGTEYLSHISYNDPEYIRWLEKRALKEMRERPFVSNCTCVKCDHDSNNCEFAFDSYNTNGDCLAVK